MEDFTEESKENLTELVKRAALNNINTIMDISCGSVASEDLEDILLDAQIVVLLKDKLVPQNKGYTGVFSFLSKEQMLRVLCMIEFGTFEMIRQDEDLDNFLWLTDIVNTYQILKKEFDERK